MQNDDFLIELLNSGVPSTPPDVEDPQIPEIDQNDPQDPPSSEEEPPASAGDPTLSAYVSFLMDNELVDLPEGISTESLTPEQLQQVFDYTKVSRLNKATEQLFNQLPSEIRPVLEYALNGGTSVKEFLSSLENDPLKNVDITTFDGQKKIVYEGLRQTSNYSEEKINRIVNKLAEDADELAFEARESYNELVALSEQRQQAAIEEARVRDIEQKKEMERRTEALHRAIDSSAVIHPQRRNKVKAFFFEPINTQEGVTTSFNYTIQSILENPEHQAQLADLLLEYDPKVGFSLDRIEKNVKNRATKDFQKALAKVIDPKGAQSSGSSSGSQNNREFDWETYNQYL
jgi:polyhydroxyalkanoate synthesis regulator phasin